MSSKSDVQPTSSEKESNTVLSERKSCAEAFHRQDKKDICQITRMMKEYKALLDLDDASDDATPTLSNLSQSISDSTVDEMLSKLELTLSNVELTDSVTVKPTTKRASIIELVPEDTDSAHGSITRSDIRIKDVQSSSTAEPASVNLTTPKSAPLTEDTLHSILHTPVVKENLNVSVCLDRKYTDEEVVAATHELQRRKPMSKECRDSILKYMVAAQRFIDIEQIPSLSAISKSLPLWMSSIELSTNFFSIDTLRWTFGTLLESPGPLPGWVKTSNDAGGLPYEVDRYGREYPFVKLEEGDLKISEGPSAIAPKKSVYRRDRPTFTAVTQYIVTCLVKKQKLVDYTVRDHTIFEVMRLQLDSYLGGLRVHHVECLKVNSSGGILRLPFLLSFRVRDLVIPTNGFNVIMKIRSLMDSSSYPLRCIQLGIDSPMDDVFLWKEVKNAQRLQLMMPKNSKKKNWFCILKLRNQSIQLFDNELSWANLVEVVNNMKVDNEEFNLNSTFSMCSHQVYELLAKFKETFNATDVIVEKRRTEPFPRALNIPINETRECNIYGEPQPFYYNVVANNKGMRYWIVVEIMPTGTAK